MKKDSKPTKTGFILTKYHLGLIVFIILLMLGVVYLYGKNKGEETIKEKPTPTPTVNLTPLPTPTPTSKPSTPQSGGSYQQKQQRVPVYLSHNGKTYYCDPVGVDAVRDASNTIVKIEEGISGCQNKTVDCANKCQEDGMRGRSQCEAAVMNFEACINSVAETAIRCLDNCKTINANCPASVNQSRYDTLNSLINTYCNP